MNNIVKLIITQMYKNLHSKIQEKSKDMYKLKKFFCSTLTRPNLLNTNYCLRISK